MIRFRRWPTRLANLLSATYFLLLAVGCASLGEYAPDGPIHELENDEYALHLREFDEKPIHPDSAIQVYRLFIDPGRRPTMIRIEHVDGKSTVVAKVRGNGGYEKHESELSAEDWQAFLAKVYETRFWLSPTYAEQLYTSIQLARTLGVTDRPTGPIYSEGPVMWIIEAWNGSLYHLGSAASTPQEGAVYELGMKMLDLAGMQSLWKKSE